MQEFKIDQKELNQRVKHVVGLSKEIPFYARKYKELEIDPDTIRSPEDLLKAYEKGLYTTPQDLPQLVYYKHPEAKGPFYTSGTTGKPKEVWLNPDDEKWFVPQCTLALSHIFKRYDKILNCFPKEPAISGYMVNRFLSANSYNFKHFPAQDIRNNLQKFIDDYKEFNPTFLLALTTFVYRLPLILGSFGIKSKLNSIIVGAEPSSIERRKLIGEEFEAEVYDTYASSENCIIAQETKPFTDEHFVPYPYTLLFLTKDKDEVSVGEVGDVVVSNLYAPDVIKPHTILLNYKIGDWAKCLEKKDNGIVTVISGIRREAAYLAGAKLDPTEVEKAIEELEEYKKELTGEYFIVNYYDDQRRAIGEVRMESKKKLPLEDKKKISERIRKRIYYGNFPVWNEVENTKNAKLLIEVTNPGELYKGYEQYIRAGKPKRLLVLKDA